MIQEKYLLWWVESHRMLVLNRIAVFFLRFYLYVDIGLQCCFVRCNSVFWRLCYNSKFDLKHFSISLAHPAVFINCIYQLNLRLEIWKLFMTIHFLGLFFIIFYCNKHYDETQKWKKNICHIRRIYHGTVTCPVVKYKKI